MMNGGMTPREFEEYLAVLRRLLRLRAGRREAIAEELQSHLEERLAALAEQGVGPKEAVSTALAEFGDAATLAAEFSAVFSAQKRRWIMRMTIGSIAATILMVGAIVSLWPDGRGNLTTPAALAQEAVQAKPAAEEADTPDPNEVTWEKLQKLGQGEFIEEPLPDVLSYLNDLSEVQFYIDERALDDVGVDRDASISLNLKDVPLEMILRLSLRQLGLTYTLDHGVVIVTTPEEAESDLIIRVYPVADLLKAEVKTPPRAAGGMGGGFGGGAGEGKGFFAVAADAAGGQGLGEDAADSKKDASKTQPGLPGAGLMGASGSAGPSKDYPGDRLIDLIIIVVEPDSWDSVGGPGAICVFDQSLVISQTWQVHRKIETLLADLREAAAEQAK